MVLIGAIGILRGTLLCVMQVLGSILAVLLYKLIKSLEFETANSDPEAAAGPIGATLAKPITPTSGASENTVVCGDGEDGRVKVEDY
jgi:hypothetical protein